MTMFKILLVLGIICGMGLYAKADNDFSFEKSFKLLSREQDNFSMSNKKVKITGSIGKHPFQKNPEGFFILWSQPVIDNLTYHKISVTMSMTFYDSKGVMLFSVSRDVALIGSKKTCKLKNVAAFSGLIPLPIWKKVTKYTISVLVSKPRKLTFYKTEPEY